MVPQHAGDKSLRTKYAQRSLKRARFLSGDFRHPHAEVGRYVERADLDPNTASAIIQKNDNL